MLHQYGKLEVWVPNPAIWKSAVRQEALQREDQTQDSTYASDALAITAGVVFALLFLSVVTLVWGTVKVSQSAAMLEQIPVHIPSKSWEKLK